MFEYIIYQKSKNIMQSLAGKNRMWFLQSKNDSRKIHVDTIVGYYQVENLTNFLHLSFNTLEEAIAYAKAKNLAYQVIEPNQIIQKSKNYNFNFTKDRKLYYY